MNKKQKKRAATAGAVVMMLMTLHMSKSASAAEIDPAVPTTTTTLLVPPPDVVLHCGPNEVESNVPPIQCLPVIPLSPSPEPVPTCRPGETLSLVPPFQCLPPIPDTTTSAAPPITLAPPVMICAPGLVLLTFEDRSQKCDDGTYYADAPPAVADTAPKAPKHHTSRKTAPQVIIEEDDPQWDCAVDGNRYCGDVEVPPWTEPWALDTPTEQG